MLIYSIYKIEFGIPLETRYKLFFVIFNVFKSHVFIFLIFKNNCMTVVESKCILAIDQLIQALLI